MSGEAPGTPASCASPSVNRQFASICLRELCTTRAGLRQKKRKAVCPLAKRASARRHASSTRGRAERIAGAWIERSAPVVNHEFRDPAVEMALGVQVRARSDVDGRLQCERRQRIPQPARETRSGLISSVICVLFSYACVEWWSGVVGCHANNTLLQPQFKIK